jgi:hypothetical protein
VAVGARAQELAIDALHLAEALGRIAVGYVEARGAQARRAQRAQHARRIAPPDRGRRDHHRVSRADARRDPRADAGQRPRADLDRVRALAELDLHAAQRAAGARRVGGIRHAAIVGRVSPAYPSFM